MLGIVGCWVVFGLAHSVLASENAKCRARALGGDAGKRFYRLAYCITSSLLLVPLVWLHVRDDAKYTFLWSFSGYGLVLSRAVAVTSAVLFGISMKLYNMSDFLGLGALRGRSGPRQKDSSAALGGDDAFSITVFHRFVRHPWYFFMLAIAWSQAMNPPRLLSAVCGTVYILIGSMLEEEKLKAHPTWGNVYAEYARSVGGVVPLPWKILSSERAAVLVAAASGAGRYRCTRRSLDRSPRRGSDNDEVDKEQ